MIQDDPKVNFCESSGVDWHRYDANPDPDPNFHYDADPYLDTDPNFYVDADPDPDPNFHVDADPDPNFHVDANPDPALDWHQNNADPHADPTPTFTNVKKSYFFYFVKARSFYKRKIKHSEEQARAQVCETHKKL